MDDVRIGAAIRVVRKRHGLSQSEVARRARVTREMVGRIERGWAGRYPLDRLRSITVALDMRLDVLLRWRGGELDRALNAGHAAMHESVGRMLATLEGWTFLPEVSYSIYGERGVIDILAWHAGARCLLVIELKTALVDPQDLVASMDRRVRLGRRIAAEHGWQPDAVSAWVVVAEGRTNRRRVAAHPVLLRARFPADGHAVRAWLRRPSGTISALSFWSDVAKGTTRRPGARPEVP